MTPQPLEIAFAVPAFEAGGVETFLLRLGRQLRARGHSVTVVATDRPGGWWGELAKQGFGAELIPRTATRFGHVRRVARRLGRFDLVLLNHASVAQSGLPRLPHDVVAIPVLHNDHPDIYRVVAKNAAAWNAAAAVSDRLRDELSRRLPGRPIAVVHHGVELPSERRVADREPPGATLRLIFVGRLLDQQKGIFLLPDILGALRARGVRTTLTIVGDGPDGAELRRRFDAAGLGGQVTFAGLLPNTAVYEQLLRHHVLLAPSRFEGFGVGLIEAQACGCVVVATDLPGVTDQVIASGETGYLAPSEDAEGFVGKVATLAGDPAHWGAMSAAATARARRLFSLDAMVDAYLGLYERARAGAYPAPRRRRGLERLLP